MYIKSYSCKRFAGIKDIDIDFEQGLNVIYGPNESGKSTIIEGIHSTLFKSINLKRNIKLDNEFKDRFFPLPIGDFIDGKITIYTDEGSFEISKEWGGNKNIKFTTPDGNIFKDEKIAQKEIKEVLKYGESTYNQVVFAKQREFKNTLENMQKDKDLSQEVNDILRMTLMELDGISINNIQQKIEKELDEIYKRWDRDKDYPENNKGINNPYKTGLGKILEKYYEKEELKLSMAEAEKTELDYERISVELKDAENKDKELQKEKILLESIEGDISSREIIELKIEKFNEKIEVFSKINKEWPRKEEIIKNLKEKKEILNQDKEKLNKEKENIAKSKNKEGYVKRLDKVNNIQSQKEQEEKSLIEIPTITKENIKELEELQKKINICKNKLEVGKMLGKINSKTEKPIIITKDFEGEQYLDKYAEFEANGFIKIKYNDEFEVEIKTIDIDFNQLRIDFENYNKEYKEKLLSLRIENIEKGKLYLENINLGKNKLERFNGEIEYILDNMSIEELKSKIEEIGDINNPRELSIIEEELKNINLKEIEYTSSIQKEEELLSNWIDEYDSIDNLFDIIINQKTELKFIEKEYNNLKPLPEKFKNIGEFKSRLSYLKEEFNENQSRLHDLRERYYDVKNNLLDDTYEELKKQYSQSEDEFVKLKTRGEKLSKIKTVFLQTKDRMEEDPMEILVKEFVASLEKITDGKYSAGDINEDFNIKIRNNDLEIPIDKLSAGTYDSVALALRFSIIKQVFKDSKGYLVLDDCLVDLDKDRKTQAIELIKEFAQDYQVIFTTCDYDTAQMLSGNLIKID